LCGGILTEGENMNTMKTIPPAVAALIPSEQLQITKSNLKVFSAVIEQLEKRLEKCPKIGETDGMNEHPAMFHYFFRSTDIYICEYNPENGSMFGYGILTGDLQNSEWGYFNVLDFSKSNYLNIDFYFEEQSIEAALHQKYPHHFKNPQIGKNDPLPEIYCDFPYLYKRTKCGTILRKNSEEIFLQGDDVTRFLQDCNRAKQHSRSISDVIEEYFIS
jgi:predicted CopG family antitoxin